MTRLVIASSNPGKLREFDALLAPLGLDVVSQGALGIAEADEPYVTFIENALAKARHASAASGLPALADDSGLCVAALGGQPGVRSARYAQPPSPEGRAEQDRRNNAKLVDALSGVERRDAWFVSVLAFLRHAEDPEPIVAAGRWVGTFVDVPRGDGGFGYDPHFWLPELGATAAELDPAVKNRLSHRAIALRRLVDELRQSGFLAPR
jgi:XTP/dITP diphosphohydrolase